jgi:hypothetical protein
MTPEIESWYDGQVAEFTAAQNNKAAFRRPHCHPASGSRVSDALDLPAEGEQELEKNQMGASHAPFLLCRPFRQYHL